ncbi:MAG: glycerol-3-phosphate 1-O-acyltransferase PlsY [Lachnospiraceae bacterium]|nr:glycerol-3-phosphate 1-O-acyltransferase PlsY [Lachnospiraceae bacterium]MCR5521466.1 glycerol-3-phosphate 1-O-acyltransferase PlsY [Lachnospiraceae bacterium]
MNVWLVICLVIAGYLFGSIPFGYIVGKFNHIDIRNYGSGNSGTTNAFRTVGRIGGIITFLGDYLKALIPILLIRYVIFADEPYMHLAILIYGFACVLGHNFPVWLKFKGGKGIAVTAGVCSGFDYLIIPVGIVLFGAIVMITKYVSLGSLLISLVIPFWVIIRFTDDSFYPWLIAVSCLYTVSAFIMHRKNIKRLIKGEENKIGQRVKIDNGSEGEA